jgi:hypothetical protein
LGGLVIKNQAVECAKKLSSAFSTGSGDGLLGLAFDKINTVTPGPVPTPVQNMNTEGVTPKVIPFIFFRLIFRVPKFSLACLLVTLRTLDTTLSVFSVLDELLMY